MGKLLVTLERIALAAERIAAHLEVLARNRPASAPTEPNLANDGQRVSSLQTASPELTSVATSLARIADHLVPSPAVVVGSRYIADRLGCTTVWVAEMARRGEVPRHCVVPGTGSGKPWKFYRERIDTWIASR
jgi:hypothetical protein